MRRLQLGQPFDPENFAMLPLPQAFETDHEKPAIGGSVPSPEAVTLPPNGARLQQLNTTAERGDLTLMSEPSEDAPQQSAGSRW